MTEKKLDKFAKYDQDKPMVGLVSPYAILSLARILTHGAKKYETHNWTKADSALRIMNACLRHCMAWLAGEDKDSESGGESHLAHAMCCLMFLEDFYQRGVMPNIDDRFKPDNTSEVLTNLIGGTRRVKDHLQDP